MHERRIVCHGDHTRKRRDVDRGRRQTTLLGHGDAESDAWAERHPTDNERIEYHGKLGAQKEAQIQMETMQLLRICLVAFPHEGRLLRTEKVQAHHWFSLDVVAGPEELVAL